jgi:hypothetical protein
MGNARKHLLERRPLPNEMNELLGMLARDTGHSRVPASPHMITGTI